MKTYEDKYRKNIHKMYSNQKLTKLNNRYLTILKNIPKGNCILDVGCGNGEFTKYFFKKYKKVYGIDISETALKLARQKKIISKQVDLDNCTNLPFESKFFDTLVCTEVLEHLITFQKVFKLFYKVLADDGFLIVTVPNAGWWRFRMNVLLGRPFYFSNDKFIELRGRDNEHLRLINVADMKKAIKPYFIIKEMLPQQGGGLTGFISKFRKSLAFRLIYIMRKEVF
ncbi:hypothetical protein LCGC14_0920320 [marine sediment metagenome]|uniref:Methyltransferase type 11 domain-containing protein n=1 Tax=marine sediment metagenome TaxID=412755 RepID=A0A0F9PBP1_9ZZZZ